jgi:electron transport complex protein RnfG
MTDWFKTGNGNIIGKNPGKNNLTVTKDGGEVDAITAATISSRAFLNAIATAYNTYKGTNDAVSSATTIENGKWKIENEEEIKKGGTQ